MGIETINQLDADYHERCDDLEITYACLEQGDTCWWPECDGKVYSFGLCTKHFQRFRRGNLLSCPLTGYENTEAADLLLEFTDIAARNGVTPEELLTMAFMTAIEKGRE